MWKLETERVRLREFQDRDAAFLLALLNDPAWLRFIGDRGVRDLEGARRYLDEKLAASYRHNGFGLWLAESLEDGRPLGMCGLVRRETLPHVDLGFAFMPESRGKGLAREAALATREHAVRRLGMKRLLAITSPLNVDSIRLLERVGFAYEREMAWGGDAQDPVRVYAYSP